MLCLHNRSSRAKLLKTDEADEALKITEKKTNSNTDNFFLKHYLDVGLLRFFFPGNFFPIIYKNNFLKHSDGLVLEEMSLVRFRVQWEPQPHIAQIH